MCAQRSLTAKVYAGVGDEVDLRLRVVRSPGPVLPSSVWHRGVHTFPPRPAALRRAGGTSGAECDSHRAFHRSVLTTEPAPLPAIGAESWLRREADLAR